jgi:tetratricopeptide (TPR) repeat protein
MKTIKWHEPGCERIIAILQNRAAVLSLIGRNMQALADITAAINISVIIKDKKCQADLLLQQSAVYSAVSDYREMQTSAERALALCRESGNTKGEAAALNNLGIVYDNQGDAQHALDCYHLSLQLRMEIGDLDDQAESYSNIGSIHIDRGDYQEAIECYMKALDIQQRLCHEWEQGYIYNNLGFIYNRTGDLQRALECYGKALALRKKIGDAYGMAHTMSNMGVLYGRMGKTDLEIEYNRKSLKIKREVGDRSGTAFGLVNLGNISREQGMYDDATLYYRQALSIAETLQEKEILRKTEIALGETMLLKNNLPAAQAHAEKAHSIAAEQGSPSGQGDALLLLARVGMAQVQKDHPVKGNDDPEKKFIEAISIYKRSNQPYDLAKAYYFYARWLEFRGLIEESKSHYAKSRKLCEKIGVKFFN